MVESEKPAMSLGTKILLAVAVLAILYFVLQHSASSPKWRVINGYDSRYNDIGKFEGTIDELKAKCLSLPNCKGFTHTGWLKNAIRPKNEWNANASVTLRIHSDRVPALNSEGVPEL